MQIQIAPGKHFQLFITHNFYISPRVLAFQFIVSFLIYFFLCYCKGKGMYTSRSAYSHIHFVSELFNSITIVGQNRTHSKQSKPVL